MGVQVLAAMLRRGLPATAAVLAWVLQPAAALQADGTVHDLTDATFDDAVLQHPYVFVEFFAPWCGHCKKLVPEWEEVAKLAQPLGIPVAKVEAIEEKKLAQAQGIQSFPTLKLYRGDPKVVSKYEGPRTAKEMVDWLKAQQLAQLIERPSAADLSTWSSKRSIALVALRAPGETTPAKVTEVLEAASFSLNPKKPGADVPVGDMEVDESDLEKLGLPGQSLPCIAMLRNFDFESKALAYSEKGRDALTPEKFLTWVQEKRMPALIPGVQENEKFFLHEIDPGNGLVVLFGGEKKLKKEIHQLAVDFTGKEKKLKWVHAQKDDFGEGIAKNVGLKTTDFPELVIWEFGETEDDDKVFRFSQTGGDLGKVAVESFIESWRDGELSAEKDPVLVLTSANFESEVVKVNKNVLVEFFAPWCGHCKALAPTYKALAKHYEKDDKVVIAKMDSTKHSHHSAEIKSYPTIKLYAQGRKGDPIDLEFKANRDTQGLIDFIEKNKEVKSKKKKEKVSADADSAVESGKKKQTKKGEEAKAGSAQPAPSSFGDGVWIFDDVMEPATRGKELTAEMVDSLGGYTLVQVGHLGVLIHSGDPAITRAVRHFGSSAEARKHVNESPAGGSSSGDSSQAVLPQRGSLPCPIDADITSCSAWCELVSPQNEPKLKGAQGGVRCGELTASSPPSQRPQCMCYTEDFATLAAMCRSPCPAENVKESAAAVGDATCVAGDSSCSAGKVASGPPASERFLLYDTKYGEGFNLQREVYPRAGWIVAQMNKAAIDKCGDRTDGPGCARWTLVLPPWCRVVHWWSGAEHTSWGEFFDLDALKQAKVPVIEYAEYVQRVGRNKVDLAIAYITDKVEADAKGRLTDGRGEFEGWSPSLEVCSMKGRNLPQHEVNDATGEYNMMYGGMCEGGVDAADFRCGVLKSPFPQCVLDMLSTITDSTSSVLLKNYDYLLSPDDTELDNLGLRESMLFAKEIRQHGDDFIRSALGSRPYLSAHCRRTDFIRVRTKTTAEPTELAKKLNSAMKARGVDQVFIATDAPDDLRDELKSQVKGNVVFYEKESFGEGKDLPGKHAAVEMWIAARSDFFIGTIESRFTSHIQLERSWLGKPKDTSEQEFCKVFEGEDGKPCISPKHRHAPRKGAHRETYQ